MSWILEKPKSDQSEVEQLMQLIEQIFLKEGRYIHCNMIQYYERYLAIAFSGRELFTDRATNDINNVRIILSKRLNKDVSIAVEKSAGTVWIQR